METQAQKRNDEMRLGERFDDGQPRRRRYVFLLRRLLDHRGYIVLPIRRKISLGSTAHSVQKFGAREAGQQVV